MTGRLLPIRLRRLGVLLAAIFGIHLLLSQYHAASDTVWAINYSESLDHWAFEIDRKAEPRKGDLVAFRPPQNPYYRDRMFVKRVAGVAGDRVTREEGRFFINGEFVALAKKISRTGKPLAPGPTGVIPQGRYFVMTDHRDSYDSRYADIGWIPRKRIIGVVTRTVL